ncbi:hypothetical protein SEA_NOTHINGSPECIAL_66 [Mycobacterium phage NothingSpecial]|nr:hypothetical protein SEA_NOTHINGSPECIAL_66 [Mycobacterium phage NothingSpecial]
MTPGERLREDIRGVVNHWLFHNGGSLTSLTDAIYDYILDTYGPPF